MSAGADARSSQAALGPEEPRAAWAGGEVAHVAGAASTKSLTCGTRVGTLSAHMPAIGRDLEQVDHRRRRGALAQAPGAAAPTAGSARAPGTRTREPRRGRGATPTPPTGRWPRRDERSVIRIVRGRNATMCSGGMPPGPITQTFGRSSEPSKPSAARARAASRRSARTSVATVRRRERGARRCRARPGRRSSRGSTA
jgi:hypothetical protein